MLALLHAVRNRISRFNERLSIARSLTELEREVQLLIASNNSWITRSAVITLFRVEVIRARHHLRAGDLESALMYRRNARETRAHIQRNLDANRRPPYRVKRQYAHS